MRRMRHLKPREIQGCQLALDASIPTSLYDATSGGSLVAANGAVARWEDQSGNARHAMMSVLGRRPLKRIAGVNGNDTCEFDGTDDFMVHGATSGTDPNTIFTVARWTNSGQTAYRGIASLGDGNNSSGAMLLMRTVSSPNIGTYTTAGAASTFSQGTTAFTASLSDKNGTYAFHANGISAGSGAANPSSQAVAHVGGITGQSTAMHCALVAMYNSDIGEHLLRRLHGCGMRKWRING